MARERILAALALAGTVAGAPAARGQAEPDPTPPPVEDPRSTQVGLEARLALLTGEATRFNSEAGFGFAIYAHRRWAESGPVGLWAGLDLAYDRFFESITVHATGSDGRERIYEDSQQLTHTSFAAMQQVRGVLGRLWGYVAGGGGLSVARFFRPFDGLAPSEEKNALVPLLRAEGGLAYDAWRDTALRLHFVYSWMFSDDRVPSGKPFTDVMDVGLGAVYRF